MLAHSGSVQNNRAEQLQCDSQPIRQRKRSRDAQEQEGHASPAQHISAHEPRLRKQARTMFQKVVNAHNMDMSNKVHLQTPMNKARHLCQSHYRPTIHLSLEPWAVHFICLVTSCRVSPKRVAKNKS